MDPTLFGGLTIAGILAAAWQQVRQLLSRIVSLVFLRIHCSNQNLVNACVNYFWKHGKRSPFGIVKYDGQWQNIRTLNHEALVVYEIIHSDPTIFWIGWRPILVSFSQHSERQPSHLTITTIRGGLNSDTFISTIANFQTQHIHENNKICQRFFITRFCGRERYIQNASINNSTSSGPPTVAMDSDPFLQRLINWERDNVGPAIPNKHKALDMLYFENGITEALQELDRWLKSRDWYTQKEIPWRRGWLLTGLPGTGKTSLVRAVAQDHDLPVCVLDLATMNNNELVDIWKTACNCPPCIVLIEDIDSIFHGRENVCNKESSGVTFDCLINCLSGITQTNGVLLVITTNDPEKLDPALVRPGRIDRIIELQKLTEKGRYQMAVRILEDCPELIMDTVREGIDETGAQFQERCARIALEQFWKRK